jgi:hypothetical protein
MSNQKIQRQVVRSKALRSRLIGEHPDAPTQRAK